MKFTAIIGGKSGGYSPQINSLKLVPIRYSWAAQGGPKMATIRAYGSAGQLLELLDALRNHVNIMDSYGNDLWWGYVDTVNINVGDDSAQIGLVDMWNAISVSYTSKNIQAVTAEDINLDSATTYGTKQLVLAGTDLDNDTAALEYRDKALAYFGLPRIQRRPPAEPGQFAELTCLGWFETLDWKLYTNSGTAQVATSAQMGTIIADSEFILGPYQSVAASGITTLETRDGGQRAGQELLKLLNLGKTSANVKYNAYVDTARYIHIKPEVASGLSADSYIDRNGDIFLSVPFYKERRFKRLCTTGVWARRLSSPINQESGPQINDPGAHFIEAAEYDIESGQLTTLVRGALKPSEVGKVLEI